MGDRLAALAVAVPFVVGSVIGPGVADGDEVFRFRDPAVVEASGLVVTGDGLFVTTNDSGDTGRVFTVDPASGETVGVTTWSAEPEDVEALAPAGDEAVWVGDIGDNSGARDTIGVTRVPVGRGDRTVSPPAYELGYPDGPQDAESLLSDGAGRLYVATKGVLGGRLYAAPRELAVDRANRLRPLGRVLPIATDGAFLPSGDLLVLRDYGRAVVYRFPSLEEVGEVNLPHERQGEAIAVAPDGTAYVTSEGREAPVFRVRLPVAEEAEPTGSPAPGSREGVELPQQPAADRPVWPWLLSGAVGLGVVGVLLLALRRR